MFRPTTNYTRIPFATEPRFSIDEVAARWRTHPSEIWRLIGTGLLIAFRDASGNWSITLDVVIRRERKLMRYR